MSAKLVAEEGALKGLVLALEGEGEWIIGRDPDACQLLVEDPSASRKHLICRTSPDGIVVENLSDTNPAKVNNQDVTKARLLNNGDTVTIGNEVFRFYSEEGAEVISEVDQDRSIPPTNIEAEEDAFMDEESEIMEKDQKIAEETFEEEEFEADEEISEEVENPSLAEQDEPKEPEEEPAEDTIFDDAEGHDAQLAQIDFGVIETGRWLLKVISGPNNGAEFGMQAGTSHVIGTDPSNCDIVFHDTSVSRQHARISVNKDDSINIEDLQSRNGTLVDGETIHGSQHLETNVVVTMGTTSFVVYDREGEMQTIISPLMPSIVKKLKGEEEEMAHEKVVEAPPVVETKLPKRKEGALSGIIMSIIVIGLLGLAGVGTFNLFKDEPAKVAEKIDPHQLIKETMAPFPSVRFYYTPKLEQLILVGHLLSLADKNRMNYNLQGLNFIKSVDDDGVVVDQLVYREMNRVLERKRWKGVNMSAVQPGRFVLNGYLKSREEAEALSDYVTANFTYLDLLENRVIVEEDLITTVQIKLQNHGIRDITVKMNNGEMTLAGGISKNEVSTYNLLLEEFKQLNGIRNLKNFVSELAPEEAMVNVTSRYEVTGVSRRGDNLNVVINGRILFKGDTIDGMTIKEIRRNAIFLEKGNIEYRIDF